MNYIADETGEPAIVDENGNEYTIDDVLNDKDSLSKGSEQTIGMDDVEKTELSIRSSVSLEDIEALKKFNN